jgi:2-succinyl-5-enolpyruvyl-6-hydroxy-3-cyclohexene-1-carboxylate synthase
MKIKVNRNILWVQIFVNQLTELGVKYACISPGSRSAPLTYVLSKNRKIKSFIHIDERSSAFFALGLAKASTKPTLLVTTSGTAVGELYPAIIEAYQQRIPLIICTADRPPELVGTGANQTINQHNIFKNHIRWFRDLGLPSISETGFHHLQKIAMRAFQISSFDDKGPIHLNFPFKKPLEPTSYTDVVHKNILNLKPVKLKRNKNYNIQTRLSEKSLIKLADDLIKYERGIIIAGPMDYDQQMIRGIKKLSGLIKYPILADGLSQLRFNSNEKDKNIISNFNSILKSEIFVEKNNPDIILQFGRTPTSAVLESFLKGTNAERYLVNLYGDNFDPTRNAKAIITIDPIFFLNNIHTYLKKKNIDRNKSTWQNNFLRAEGLSEKIKSRIIERSKFPNESALIKEILSYIPASSHIFIGNSLPVRDLDSFSGIIAKRCSIHFNRGASGIDGVTSTAFGIASQKSPMFLIIGDLSLIHDLNSLIIASKYSIPIIIVVINNNGGGIFESLPIAEKVNRFKEYFVTPHNLELSDIIKSFGLSYHLLSSKSALKKQIMNCSIKKIASVLEIQTNAKKSEELRKKYFAEVQKKINREFINDN